MTIFNRSRIIGSLTGLLLLLAFTPNIALTHTKVATAISASANQNTNKFSQIEQPIILKLLVALGGMGLIGADLWWFVFSKTKSR